MRATQGRRRVGGGWRLVATISHTRPGFVIVRRGHVGVAITGGGHGRGQEVGGGGGEGGV